MTSELELSRTDELPAPRPGHRAAAVIGRFRRPMLAAVAFAAAGVVLFIAYLGQTRTLAVGPDGASQALQAWDMLHGNLLLHGWTLTDVTFYTTELPEYMLVEFVHGLTGDVVHIAAALTYTLLVLLTGLVAKGNATGREALVRVLVACGILLAPPLGVFSTTGVVLRNPDHTGTQVPLLLIWLILGGAPFADGAVVLPVPGGRGAVVRPPGDPDPDRDQAGRRVRLQPACGDVLHRERHVSALRAEA